MIILFVILFLISSELIQSTAVARQEGFNPYPFATPILCILIHLLLLISCIFYLGWLFGILLFLAHFFNIVHATVSWIFGIPALFIRGSQLLRYILFQHSMLFNLAILNFAFTIASFFVSDFKSFLNYFKCSSGLAIPLVAAILVLSISRLFVAHYASRRS